MRLLIPLLLATMAVGVVHAQSPTPSSDELPTMFSPAAEAPPADLDVTFSDDATVESGGDYAASKWEADVEEALKYLYQNQLKIIERLEKVEQALVAVRTASGQIESRAVPVQAGQGDFYLGPGESVVGYQDVITGRWVDCRQQPAQQVQRLIPMQTMTVSEPVRYASYTQQTYTTPTTQMQVARDPRSGLIRGRVFARFMSCGPGGCGG